ncbi:hypothetical protein Cni_G10386 [Canna indica]|uniref:Uncharacterized protein n=1 Tax=Canna indica TaxID=4628 RepID=A0AAQ3K5N6_9LILI|nr:hypothetical protein Cni_G10386 [Canna indica]
MTSSDRVSDLQTSHLLGNDRVPICWIVEKTVAVSRLADMGDDEINMKLGYFWFRSADPDACAKLRGMEA